MALAALGVYAWGSPIRFPAVSTVLALIIFHGLARLYIGKYGPGIESAYAVAVVASVIAVAHLAFQYSSLGLMTGIAFALIPLFTGLASKGWVPILYQQGPGLWDYWTLVSLCAWAVWLILAYAIWSARHALG